MRKEINLVVVGSMIFSAACAKPPEPEITSALSPTPTHEPTPTFEPTPTLPANLEGAEQWKEECLLHPVVAQLVEIQGFSVKHKGVDFVVDTVGYHARTSLSGTVVYSDWDSHGYGKLVIIQTPTNNGLFVQTRYAHLERLVAKEGQEIRQGQPLGIIGSTGYSSDTHLHFEIVTTNWPLNHLAWNADWIWVKETAEAIDSLENEYGEEQIEWIDPLGLIKDACQ